MVKMALGMRLKDGDRIRDCEDGASEERSRLDAIQGNIYETNLQKRRREEEVCSLRSPSIIAF